MRDNGIDIAYIGEDHPSIIADQKIIEIANKEDRTIITFDKDFGELIYRFNLKPKAGVIYLRLCEFKPDDSAKLLLKIFDIEELEFRW